MDPKIKALGSMALYGTIGGILLGTASLAFGAESRAIAKGASLGLYAGLLFGGYVVLGHALRRKNRRPEYIDDYPEGADSTYGVQYSQDPQGGGQRWASYWENHYSSHGLKIRPFDRFGNRDEQTYYLNLMRLSF